MNLHVSKSGCRRGLISSLLCLWVYCDLFAPSEIILLCVRFMRLEVAWSNISLGKAIVC